MLVVFASPYLLIMISSNMIQRWTPGQVLKQQVDRTLSLLSQSRTGKLNVTMSPTLSSPSYELRNHRSFRQPTSSAMNGLLPVKNTLALLALFRLWCFHAISGLLIGEGASICFIFKIPTAPLFNCFESRTLLDPGCNVD